MQLYTKLEEINFNNKRVVKVLITLLLLFTFITVKSQDSIPTKLNFVVGAKFFNSDAAPEIRTASNLGLDYYPFKNKKVSLSYRSFFNLFLTPRDSTFPKAVRLLQARNCLQINYQLNFKKSHIKLGIGPYVGRDQTFIDQVFILSDRTEYGIEYSLYSKLQWMNIGFRHQVGLITDAVRVTEIRDLNRFAICIEIPIKLK